MPYKNSSNNRILPANARASDVASKAIQEILPVQQVRNMSAHRVQGFPSILYNRLTQGQKCTCNASDIKLGTRLGEDGKAAPGTVNELITGALHFNVSPYGSTGPKDDPFDSVTSPHANNKYQGTFDNVGREATSLPTRIEDSEAFGDNGPLQDFDIEDMVGGFDTANLGTTDATCAVCFGTSFVGGYAPFHAQRIVLTVDNVELGLSTLNLLKHPWSARGTSFSARVVLPYGAIGVDSFKVYNGRKIVPANFSVDAQIINAVSVLAFCDGRPHDLVASFAGEVEWTHLEIQFILSSDSAFFEFPKLSQSADTNLLEKTEPFQIVMASNLPNLKAEDVVVESVYGKVLEVQTVNWWNDRNRSVLGWECQVRPVQPQELYNILPRRGRVLTKTPTSVGVHDNMRGTLRT
jgi:hypothetical protein